MTPNRSFLFTPGNHARRVEKALGIGADVVILDLEDAVAVAEKAAARDTVAGALEQAREGRAYVRVNGIDTEFCFDDLAAVVGPNLDGIVLPMAEIATDVKTIDWTLANLERRAGLPVGGIDLMPIIETAAGLAAAREICAAGTRVKRIAFGAGDYTRDLDLVWTLEENEIAAARAELVLASRLGGIEPPIDTVFIHIKDHKNFIVSSRRGREFGFQGRMCIHPDQIEPTHAAYTPTDEAADRARRIVEAFQEAEARGLASIQVDGSFVDYPIAEKARRVVALHDAVKAASGDSVSARRQ